MDFSGIRSESNPNINVSGECSVCSEHCLNCRCGRKSSLQIMNECGLLECLGSDITSQSYTKKILDIFRKSNIPEIPDT